MKWIKQKADVTTYRCSRCGSIWMTVKIKAKPPKRCKACGVLDFLGWERMKKKNQ